MNDASLSPPSAKGRRTLLAVAASVTMSPSLYKLPPVCTFHPRCPQFESGLCDVVVPALATPQGSTADGHDVSCHVMTRPAG